MPIRARLNSPPTRTPFSFRNRYQRTAATAAKTSAPTATAMSRGPLASSDSPYAVSADLHGDRDPERGVEPRGRPQRPGEPLAGRLGGSELGGRIGREG